MEKEWDQDRQDQIWRQHKKTSEKIFLADKPETASSGNMQQNPFYFMLL